MTDQVSTDIVRVTHSATEKSAWVEVEFRNASGERFVAQFDDRRMFRFSEIIESANRTAQKMRPPRGGIPRGIPVGEKDRGIP